MAQPAGLIAWSDYTIFVAIYWGTPLNHLGMFAKFWQPKTVKTRLAAGIGDLLACELYRDFVFHLLARHLNTGDTRTLVFSPLTQENEFRFVIPRSWKLVPQSAGDLGTRMRGFFEYQFSLSRGVDHSASPPPTKVVIMGADCPQLGTEVIQSAWEKLDHSDVVLGPSSDGGYYLIGMRGRCFNVFDHVAWSSPDVLEQTIAQVDHQQLGYALLPELTDIDDRDDLVALEALFRIQEQQGTLEMLDAQLLMRIKQVMNTVSNWERDSV